MVTPTAAGAFSHVSLFGSNYIDSLLAGTKWGSITGIPANLTYSFGSANSNYKNNYYSGEPLSNFAPFTTIQENAARKALAAWGEVANIQFTEVIDSPSLVGDIRFAKSNKPSTGWAYNPSGSPEGGDVWFSHRDIYNTDIKGSYGYSVFLHEIGHALGLKEPHDPNFGGVADINIDTTAYSVMSYKSYVGSQLNHLSQAFYSSTPMLHDIAAIQYLYGANLNTRSGNTIYSWEPGQQLLETIWDGGGVDTISWANQSSAAKINLGTGQWSELGPAYWNGVKWENQTLAIAYNVTIENAIGGSGNDTLTGNNVANTLQGGAGNDILVGGFDSDILIGGGGADSFVFNSPAEGTDTIADFQTYEGDQILVWASGFGAGLPIGTLGASQFTMGAAATDASDRFIYNPSSGELFFDADGTGALGEVKFASLATGLNLNSNDISVFA
ncbi:M10 family metallopeptidase C-terminal domain-containing protein [Lyngbya aestuarii]|uniref:M10 family metallopeptidase C-terminal domain-containing protein n=1 Tax=Lyngbya aestuarii TaxID=118322 RepID=UPI00403E00B0